MQITKTRVNPVISENHEMGKWYYQRKTQQEQN